MSISILALKLSTGAIWLRLYSVPYILFCAALDKREMERKREDDVFVCVLRLLSFTQTGIGPGQVDPWSTSVSDLDFSHVSRWNVVFGLLESFRRLILPRL